MSGKLFCSFCNSAGKDVGVLFTPDKSPMEMYICDNCVTLCKKRLPIEKSRENKSLEEFPISSALDDLSKSVVGHTRAKQQLIMHFQRYYRRLRGFEEYDSTTGINVLMIGPTGTGKTHMITNFSRITGITCISVNTAVLTAEGFVGTSVTDVIKMGLTRLEEQGKVINEDGIIIHWDECGKIGDKGKNNNTIGTTDVQDQILKVIEGGTISVEMSGKFVSIQTKHIFSVFTGSFSNMINRSYGSAIPPAQLYNKEHTKELKMLRENTDQNSIRAEDIHDAGFSFEFIGRMNGIIRLGELTYENYKTIWADHIFLKKQKELEVDNIIMEYDENFSSLMINVCKSSKTGVRGMMSRLNTLTENAHYVACVEKDKRKSTILKLGTCKNNCILKCEEVVVLKKEAKNNKQNMDASSAA